jgi:hypothetical protein
MPVPDFSPGEVLTAAAMDSIGLWLVKTQTVGAGVASVTVTDAFSADYDNYKVTYTGGTGTNNSVLGFHFVGTNGNTTFYGNLYYANFTNGAPQTFGWNNAASVSHLGGNAFDRWNMNAEIHGPHLTQGTFLSSPFVDGFNAGVVQAVHNIASSYTSFVLTPSTGTLTGGTIRVYGYRN